GVQIGAYGTKVVKESIIRLATACIIALCVLSRAIAIPVYLRQLGYINYDSAWDGTFQMISKTMLYVSGISGALIILVFVFRAYFQRRRLRASIVSAGPSRVSEART
ncbi:MAG TPA: hypothetical protein PKW66_21905, partial [Polyangiaceae bacterium]|nr:hypothetical protein [Polyangiaceae bacterium]